MAAGANEAGGQVIFVATIPPVAAILREVVGDRAKVTTLLPAGSSPHTFLPKPSQIKNVEKALALFMAGANLDKEWAGRMPAVQQIEMVSLLPEDMRLHAVGHRHGVDAPRDHSHEGEGGIDSHFWTDPLTVRDLLPELFARLVSLDPAGKSVYLANTQRFRDELEALHTELKSLLKPVRTRPFFLFHPSFQYLFNRYGLQVAGLIEPLPGREPTPKSLKNLVSRIKSTGATVIFSETQLPVRPAQVLAEAAGVTFHQLDPLGGTVGRMGYAELMRYNAGILRRAAP